MIAVAVVVRSAIDSDGGTTGPRAKTVACVAELQVECRALKNVNLRVEDAVVTAKTLANGTANIDAWVTFEPWPTIANLLAGRDVVGTATRVARTDLVIAMAQDRAQRLAPTCGGTVNWKCLGDAIGQSWTAVGGEAIWGTVKAGIPPL